LHEFRCSLLRRWLEAWRDLRELQGAGAFALLTKEAMLAELCRALLRGSHFSLAQSYLQVCPPARTRLFPNGTGYDSGCWRHCQHAERAFIVGRAISRAADMSSPQCQWVKISALCVVCCTVSGGTALPLLSLLRSAVHADLQSGGTVRLDRGAADRLVLAAAREHFYSADSLDAPGVAAAQRCLALLPESAQARAEGDAITALMRLHREHKYAMLPAAFKQVRSSMGRLSVHARSALLPS
jgi:hypothetical protein